MRSKRKNLESEATDLTEPVERNLEKRDPESEVLEEGTRRLRETQRHIFFFFFFLNPQAGSDSTQIRRNEVGRRIRFFFVYLRTR